MSDVSKITSSSKSYASALNEKFAQKRYERQQNSDISVVQTVEEVNLEDLQNSINYDNVSQDELTTSFVDILQDNVATDAYSASMQEWANVSDSNVDYWTDNPLRLTLHEGSGAYLIEQQDANGNWVAMGYTDANTAQAYLEKINLSANNNGSNYSNDILAFKEEQMTGQNPNDNNTVNNINSVSNTTGSNYSDDVLTFKEEQMMRENSNDSTEYVKINRGEEVNVNGKMLYCYGTTDSGTKLYSNDDGKLFYVNSQGDTVPVLFKDQNGTFTEYVTIDNIQVSISSSQRPGQENYFTPSFEVGGYKITVDNISTSIKVPTE